MQRLGDDFRQAKMRRLFRAPLFEHLSNWASVRKYTPGEAGAAHVRLSCCPNFGLDTAVDYAWGFAGAGLEPFSKTSAPWGQVNHSCLERVQTWREIASQSGSSNEPTASARKPG